MKALIIGDSHAEGGFGKALRDELQALGYSVTLAGVGATAIRTWKKKQLVCHPDGTHCQDQSTLPKNVDLLVVVLGTNDGANALAANEDLDKAADKNIALLAKVVDSYSPSQWFWIGPPWMGDNVKHYTNAAMDAVYAGAARNGVPIFDSRPVTKPLVESGSGDGVHVGAKAAKKWAQAAVAALQSAGGSPTGQADDDSSSIPDSQPAQTDNSGAFLVLVAAAVVGWLLARRR